jgi:probable rRNA maturation factor
LSVHVTCDHPRGRAAATRLKRRATAFLGALGKGDAELSVLVVGDRGIRRLNREWRGKDVATDVLSFPAAAEHAGALIGDVVVSLDTAARVAEAEGRPLVEELDRYLVHGILHLLGFDHETEAEAKAMAAQEDEVLARHGMVSAARAAHAPSPRAKRGGGSGAARSRARPGPRSGSASKSSRKKSR